VILVAESDAFFTADGARAMRAVVAALEDLDAVRSVLWMDAAPMLNIFGLPEPVLPRGHASPARFAAARQRALAHPLVGGQLLSADGRTLLLLIDMEWLYVTSDADCTVQLRKTAEQAAAAFPSVPIAFQLTGNVPIRISNAANTRGNERKYQLIGYGLSLAIAWVLFRGPEAVLIVALAPAFGVFWTMGLLPLFGLGGNPFNAVVVPVLLCMVGFTDGVHMMAQIRRHRALGLEPAEATRAAIREVGLACWLTSLTTAIGFGSLAWAHHEVVREFGYSCVIGVLATFFSVVTIVPLACASPLGRRVHRGYGANLIDQNLQRISVVVDCILRHSRAVAWGSLAGTAVLAAVTLQLRPDERLTSSLPAGSEAGSALARIDRQFGGMETARVEIGWSADVPDGAAEIGAVAAAAAEAVRSEPLLGSPLSIVELLDALPGEGPAGSRMSLLELLPPPLKRAYYVPEQRRANVTFRLQDIGIAHYGPVFERLEKRLAAIQRQHPRFALQLDGSAIWRWKDLYRIVLDLIASLGSASLIIFGVMAVSYRSLRIGLIAVPANLFPLVATGAMLYGAGQSLEIVSVCSFTICLGIAVDDTIHFLTRFQEEQARCGERLPAIRNAFVGVGAAMIMTTVVLAMGFGSALLSDARDHRLFATMGILTILTALVADLLFLPALLAQFAPPPPRTAENVLAD
jgi:predicted RND superfamily exporter protein